MAATPSRFFHQSGYAPIGTIHFAPFQEDHITLPYAQPKPPLPSGPMTWNKNVRFPSIMSIFGKGPRGAQQT